MERKEFKRLLRWKFMVAGVALVAAMSLLPSGCVSETPYGTCVGIVQSDRRDPRLVYELSTWNLFLAIAGVELIFPPLLVLHHETYCPTRRRAESGEPKTNALGETRIK